MIHEISYRDIGSRYQNSRRILSRWREAHSLDTWPAAKTHILRIKERNHGETITRHSFKENRHDSKPFRESFQPIARRSVGWTCRTAFYQRKETVVHDEFSQWRRARARSNACVYRSRKTLICLLFAKWVEIEWHGKSKQFRFFLEHTAVSIDSESNEIILVYFLRFLLSPACYSPLVFDRFPDKANDDG